MIRLGKVIELNGLYAPRKDKELVQSSVTTELEADRLIIDQSSVFYCWGPAQGLVHARQTLYL